jgi:hypothetical protein
MLLLLASSKKSPNNLKNKKILSINIAGETS